MRRRIEALADQLEEFVSEDGHDALVVHGEGAIAGVLGAAVDLTQQRGSIDVSLPFFDAFESEAALASAMEARVAAVAAGAQLRVDHGPPAESPVERVVRRLVALAAAVRSRGDVRVAVWICPSSIADERAYVRLVAQLVSSCRRADPPLRIGAREACAIERPLRSALRRAAIPTLEVAVDVSPSAIRDALAEDAMDPRADPAARAAAALSVAMADAAAGKTDDALLALAALAEFHAARGDAASRALCFVLAGGVEATVRDLALARARVSQGLALAIEARAVPVVLVGAMQAGQLSMRAGDAADADARFDVAARLAARLGAPELVAEALLGRGHALRARNELASARDVWLSAVEAARRAGSTEHARAGLEALADLYRSARMPAQARVIDEALGGDARPHASSRACADHGHAP